MDNALVPYIYTNRDFCIHILVFNTNIVLFKKIVKTLWATLVMNGLIVYPLLSEIRL